MGAEHRRNIELHGAAGDLVRHARVVAADLEQTRSGSLARWLQQAVLGVVQRVIEGTGVEDAADRVGVALLASAGVLGPTGPVLRAEAALSSVRRWWRFDPVRDGRPPKINRAPADTLPPK